MAHFSYPEGLSKNRPPLLLGSENYNVWKSCMETYLKRDPREWNAVENGFTITKKTDGILESTKELSQHEVDACTYNDRAMDTLVRGMIGSEVEKIMHLSCTTAKEIWDNLSDIHIRAPITSSSKSLYQARPWYRAGRSIKRPPLLLRSENYNWWKFCMKIFLKRDARLWDSVENGYTIPNKTDGTPKRFVDEDLTPEEAKLHSYNYEALYTLLCGLPDSELSKIYFCTGEEIWDKPTAKVIWDSVRYIHEGILPIQKAKLRRFMQDYYVFKLEKDEGINEAEARFITLLNSLDQLGKRIPQSDINWKLLGIMPKRFAPIVTTLEDNSTISTMSSFTLFGILKEYENKLKRYKEEDEAFDLSLDEEDIDKEISILSQRLADLKKGKRSLNKAANFSDKKKNKA